MLVQKRPERSDLRSDLAGTDHRLAEALALAPPSDALEGTASPRLP
jgi:hypothetical protein